MDPYTAINNTEYDYGNNNNNDNNNNNNNNNSMSSNPIVNENNIDFVSPSLSLLSPSYNCDNSNSPYLFSSSPLLTTETANYNNSARTNTNTNTNTNTTTKISAAVATVVNEFLLLENKTNQQLLLQQLQHQQKSLPLQQQMTQSQQSQQQRQRQQSQQTQPQSQQEIIPNSLVELEKISSNSLVELEEISPNSLVELEEISPTSLVELEEISPNSLEELDHQITAMEQSQQQQLQQQQSLPQQQQQQLQSQQQPHQVITLTEIKGNTAADFHNLEGFFSSSTPTIFPVEVESEVEAVSAQQPSSYLNATNTQQQQLMSQQPHQVIALTEVNENVAANYNNLEGLFSSSTPTTFPAEVEVEAVLAQQQPSSYLNATNTAGFSTYSPPSQATFSSLAAAASLNPQEAAAQHESLLRPLSSNCVTQPNNNPASIFNTDILNDQKQQPQQQEISKKAFQTIDLFDDDDLFRVTEIDEDTDDTDDDSEDLDDGTFSLSLQPQAPKQQKQREVQQEVVEQVLPSVVIKAVEVVSKESESAYLQETLETHVQQMEALEAEFDDLGFDEKHKIMFNVHGVSSLPLTLDMSTNSASTNSPKAAGGDGADGTTDVNGDGDIDVSGHGTSSNKNTEDTKIIDEYLQKLDNELNLRVLNYYSKDRNNDLDLQEIDNALVLRVLNYDDTTKNAGLELQDIDINVQYETDVTAFRAAQMLNPIYVNSRKFRLMFLRMYSLGNNINNDTDFVYYNIGKVATKIISYFNVKKSLFGVVSKTNNQDCILGRDIRLNDLSVDDRAALNSGACQILPERDVAGRCIMIYAPYQRVYKNINNWCRAFWYIWQCYINNEENQLSGCVNIFHAKGYIARKQRDTFDDVRAVIRVKDSMMGDSQMVALHYCYNDIAMKSMVTAQKLHFMNKHVRSHFREHYSIYHNDICFKLETFGIPIDKEIFLPNGELGLKWFDEWLNCRELEENGSVSSSMSMPININNNNNINTNINDVVTSNDNVEDADSGGDAAGGDNSTNNTNNNSNTPAAPITAVTNVVPAVITIVRKFDVLFGKGKTREFVGNLRCAYLVEQHEIEYEDANKIDKTQIANKIVNIVKANNGRFLKKDKQSGWMEVTEKQAREKVSHFFRRRRELHTISESKNPESTTNPTNTQQEKRVLPS